MYFVEVTHHDADSMAHSFIGPFRSREQAEKMRDRLLRAIEWPDDMNDPLYVNVHQLRHARGWRDLAEEWS